MAAPLAVADLREKARRIWERDGRGWAAGQVDSDSALINIPLHPPTERDVLSDYAGSLAWVESWRAVDGNHLTVAWQTRHWGRVGAQAVPTRVRVEGAFAIASVAGTSVTWKQWRGRAAELVAALDPDSGATIASAIRTHIRVIGALDTTDFHRLRDVSRWLRMNPMSGRYIRELPIRGIDSKWLERHRSMVEDLVGGAGLGLRQPPALVRIRFLDRALAPIGVSDLTAPLAELHGLDIQPPSVLVVENLQTFLALPNLPGTIAVDGRGNVAPRLAAIDWVRGAHQVYWGDLDSHGLRILSQTRAAGLAVQSCLMDSDTLLAFRDLWVPEPTPFRGNLGHLTAAERATLATLRDEGNVRLEQERIAWDFALHRLAAVL